MMMMNSLRVLNSYSVSIIHQLTFILVHQEIMLLLRCRFEKKETVWDLWRNKTRFILSHEFIESTPQHVFLAHKDHLLERDKIDASSS